MLGNSAEILISTKPIYCAAVRRGRLIRIFFPKKKSSRRQSREEERIQSLLFRSPKLRYASTASIFVTLFTGRLLLSMYQTTTTSATGSSIPSTIRFPRFQSIASTNRCFHETQSVPVSWSRRLVLGPKLECVDAFSSSDRDTDTFIPRNQS